MSHQPLYLSATLRQLESTVKALTPAPALMERAGLACAEAARRMLADSGRVLVVAGPGNNGGDAFVAARHLKAWWYDVTLVFCADKDSLPTDASQALRAWCNAGGTLLDAIPTGQHWDLCIDGLFGIGLQRDLVPPWSNLVGQINDLGIPVLAIDVPSGLCADTGVVRGSAIRASRTVTFFGLKPGLFTLDGPDHCGQISVDALGTGANGLHRQDGWLIESAFAVARLKPRTRNSHKGTYGSAAILGGAEGMMGAALLSARAALRLGAGKVYVGFCMESPPICDWGQPELMLRHADTVLNLPGLTTLAIGPGLGTSDEARSLLEQTISTSLPLILDADALNLIATTSTLSIALAQRPSPSILTPHPAEAARLLSCSVDEVQADRVGAATAMAKRFSAHVVLKGAGSVCANPAGTWFINPTGNAALASAGTGDVLTGIIVALLAQGLPMEDAMLSGVNIHGAAADDLASRTTGPIGIIAGDVINAARYRLNQLVYSRADR